MKSTEFGHVDVAILFTLLSYYYSDLSDEQIESAITSIAEKLNPTDEYNKYLAEVSISLMRCVEIALNSDFLLFRRLEIG